MNAKIDIVLGDITRQSVDAIVNAANNSLLGGGGVDGAIHRAAGSQLLEACRLLKGCATGEAKITKGFALSAKWVIHTVGPVWHGGHDDEDQLLASCYRNSLILAEKNNLASIAFPSISTGVYGFPVERAAPLAINETKKFLKQESVIRMIRFVCFDQRNFEIYHSLLK